MKPTLAWLMLIGALVVFDTDFAAAWNRQLYNRYSRNLYRNAEGAPPNEIDELSALFGVGGAAAPAGGVLDSGLQQNEVYGIVEPLIEDTPCVDRACTVNGDCCPSGVCIRQFAAGAEAKCVYLYGRKPDFCRRHSDCEPGMSCLKGAAGNMVCQPVPPPPPPPSMPHFFGGHDKPLGERQYGEECFTTNDCNVARGMCCQFQRSHHRAVPKRMCAYFRDPFMCIDIVPSAEEEEATRFLSSFNPKRL